MAVTQKRQSRWKLGNEEPNVPKLGISFGDRIQLQPKQRQTQIRTVSSENKFHFIIAPEIYTCKSERFYISSSFSFFLAVRGGLREFPNQGLNQ